MSPLHAFAEKIKSLKETEHSKASWEVGQDKIKFLAHMRKKEIDRIFKINMPKELDERLKYTLQKTFKFLFGRLGNESYTRFLKEKSVIA